MVPQPTQAISARVVNCTTLALENLMGWESRFRCCVWQSRARSVSGASLLCQTKGALAAITVLTSLSPGCIAAGLSRSALCATPWVLHAIQSLLHPEAATVLICMLPVNIVFSRAIWCLWNLWLMIPVKMCWLFPLPLHPSFCAQWHPGTRWNISKRGRNYATKDHFFPLKHPWDPPPNLCNIPLGEQKFHRTILRWGGLYLWSLAVP